MDAKRFLSKSRFKMAVECPTKLFYTGKADEYCDTLQGNDFLALLAEGGYQVGELAKFFYPDRVEITEIDSELAIQRTVELLKNENIVLIEPAIRFGNFLTRIDILVKTGNRFELVEVKAKSYDSSASDFVGKKSGRVSSSMRPYLHDAAFQTWVLQQAFPGAGISTFLIMPDKSKKSPVDGVNQMLKICKVGNRIKIETRFPDGLNVNELAASLLEKVCVDEHVSLILRSPLEVPGGVGYLPDLVDEWATAYSADRKIPPTIGAQCDSCQYKATSNNTCKSGFEECWSSAAGLNRQDFERGTVLDLWNFRKKQKLIDSRIFRISEVRREHLEDSKGGADTPWLTRVQRQWLQIAGIPKNHEFEDFYLDTSLLQREIHSWKYPFHMIDFETSSLALPFYKNMSPYEAVAFQFSHHVIEADGRVRHAGQYLSTEPGFFPNFEFAYKLKQELDRDSGTVFMWSPHEHTILAKIVDQLRAHTSDVDRKDQLVNFLNSLLRGGEREMVDLCKLAERAFFHPDTKGSSSIKKVLPATLKISDFLRGVYSTPIYGSENGIPSHNFKNMVWIDSGGNSIDPYMKLKNLTEDLLPVGIDKYSVIADGGAATTAYSRLQFEDLNDEVRSRICAALLRYCELDTLAMVMVVQAWKHFVEEKNERSKKTLNQ